MRRIPGLCFHYDSSQRLSYFKIVWPSFRYVTDLPYLVRQLEKDIEADQPKLVITDYEPALPRAARRCGVPFISLDHQHFLVAYDLSSLPPQLRLHAAFMAQIVRVYYTGEAETIVSAFYFPPLKPTHQDAKQIGILMGPEVLHAYRRNGAHLVAYLRRSASQALLEALSQCGCEVRIYGLGVQPTAGSLRFFDVDVLRFVEDLATSRALISTAGNQLVGEALYLEKPVLAIPEPGNYEQQINAHFLRQSGAGTSVEMESIAPDQVRQFLDRLDKFRGRIDRDRLYGNAKALSIIRQYLEEPSPEGAELVKEKVLV